MKSAISYDRRPITSPKSIEDYLMDQATRDKDEDRMENSTYDEIFDIEPETFEMLESCGGQRGVLNESHVREIVGHPQIADSEDETGAYAAGQKIAQNLDDLEDVAEFEREDYQSLAKNVFDSIYRRTENPETGMRAIEGAMSQLDTFGYDTTGMAEEADDLAEAVSEIEKDPSFDSQWNGWGNVFDTVSSGDIKRRA